MTAPLLAPCADCETDIPVAAGVCPDCGNRPRTQALLAVGATAIFAALLYAMLPTLGLLLLPVVLLVAIDAIFLEHSATERRSLI